MATPKTLAPRMASWRGAGDAVVCQTPGRGLCRQPRCRTTLRAVSGDYERALRCRKCQGCREYDQEVAIGRLQKAYPEPCELYRLRLKAPEAQHAPLSRRLHGARQCKLEPGLFRDGPDAVFFLGRDRHALHLAAAKLGISHPEIHRIRFGHGRATWSRLTAGVAIPHAAPGAAATPAAPGRHYRPQANRFYCRGLPKPDKLEWSIQRLPKPQAYDLKRSPRVWDHARNLVLVPPEAWSTPRSWARPQQFDFFDPDHPPPGATVHSRSLMTFNGAAQPLSAEEVRANYAAHAVRRQERERLESANSLASQSVEKPYVSSGHDPPAEPTQVRSDEELARASPSGRPVWMERELQEHVLRQQRRESLAPTPATPAAAPGAAPTPAGPIPAAPTPATPRLAEDGLIPREAYRNAGRTAPLWLLDRLKRR